MEKELYKVRNITISLLDKTSRDPNTSIICEFGVVTEKEGILYLVTHILNYDDFSVFDYKSLGCRASAKMTTFNNIEIEASWMKFTEMTTNENTVIFKCFEYITVKEEDKYYSYQISMGNEMVYSQLLTVDFWGLDLLVKYQTNPLLIVANAPFEIQIYKDKKLDIMCASFPCNNKVAHNTLTDELFELFRESLVGYLSLINGARVQITKEHYNGFIKIYSYNRIDNIDRSLYTCGNAKLFSPSPVLFEFDNYVRWNSLINLNKFIHHLCTAEQVIDYEDRSFILILAFEGLSKRYYELQKDRIAKKIISKSSFKRLKKELEDIIYKQEELDDDSKLKLIKGIPSLNDVGLATYKFRLILEDLNIPQTEEIQLLLKNVRSTLVHEAELKDYADCILLSELIREIILRLINSKVKRHSRFTENVFLGEPPNLPFAQYLNEKLNLTVPPIISKYDERINLRMSESCYDSI